MRLPRMASYLMSSELQLAYLLGRLLHSTMLTCSFFMTAARTAFLNPHTFFFLLRIRPRDYNNRAPADHVPP